MPIYQYECSSCNTVFEKRQGFHDEPLAICPEGHNDVRRLIAMPAIVFKGSGFYINDSKGDKSSANGVSKDKESKEKDSPSEDKSGSNGSEKKTESKAESKTTESSKASSDSSKSSSSSSD